ncbi:hypothetical protein IIA16_00370, partial [bacterium]|nr:hypothetical protein [bacterium]
LHRRRRFRPTDIGAFVRDAREVAQAVVASAARGPERNISPLRPANLMPDNPAPPKSPKAGP